MPPNSLGCASYASAHLFPFDSDSMDRAWAHYGIKHAQGIFPPGKLWQVPAKRGTLAEPCRQHLG